MKTRKWRYSLNLTAVGAGLGERLLLRPAPLPLPLSSALFLHGSERRRESELQEASDGFHFVASGAVLPLLRVLLEEGLPTLRLVVARRIRLVTVRASLDVNLFVTYPNAALTGDCLATRKTEDPQTARAVHRSFLRLGLEMIVSGRQVG